MMNASSRIKALTGITAAAVLAALIYGVVLISASAQAPAEDAPIAQVNGDPITAAEFNRLLGLQRAVVIDYFKRTYGAEFGKQFWSADYGGEVPAAMAKEQALQEAVRQRIILNLAKAHGLIQGSSYRDVLAEMARENERRQAAVQAGRPIYGPVQFDENVFVDFYMNKVLIGLKEKLSGAGPAITDDELLRHYELIKDELFALENRVAFHYISVSYSGNGGSGDDGLRQQALEAMETVKLQLEQGRTVDEAVGALPGGGAALELHVSEEQFSRETASNYYRTAPELYAVLTDEPQAGQISPVIHNGATRQYALAVIIETAPGGYKSFDDQKGNVRKAYIDAWFDDYLGKLVKEAKVTISEDRYSRITMQ